jgi:3-hydroxyisobutyrate dehydrogenase-like beta-hydroxyacid dehydrogenase
MTDVAVIGLGIMGHAMADHLRRGGHTVAVWNRNPRKADDLVEAGARLAASPADAAGQADLVFEVTADDASSRAVWLDPDTGILAGARPGAVLTTSATLSVGWIADLAEACAATGRPFLDMPLTGGRVGAEAGQLTLLVGGDPDVLAGISPTLDAIAKDVRHFGPVGAGTRFKLVLNALQAVHLAAFGEAMRLATAAGLDEAQVAEALVARPGGIVTQMAADGWLAAPDQVSFSVGWALKDLGYAEDMAPDDVAHPLLSDVRAVFERTAAAGHFDSDWTTVNDPIHSRP